LVTYFPDLSIYCYLRRLDSKTLNVGWLDADHDFEKAVPADEVLGALWHFIKHGPVEETRGLHPCEFCPRDPEYLDRLRSLRARMADPADPLHRVPMGKIPWPEDARSRSVFARRGDEQLTIGSAEIRVFGERGAIYAAPTLIYHYVLEHRYKLPDDFVRGLLGGPRPPTDEYRALLRVLDAQGDGA
jgi:hypothetical protein